MRYFHTLLFISCNLYILLLIFKFVLFYFNKNFVLHLNYFQQCFNEHEIIVESNSIKVLKTLGNISKPLFSLLKFYLSNKFGEEGKPSSFPPSPSPTPLLNFFLFFIRFSLQEETFFFFSRACSKSISSLGRFIPHPQETSVVAAPLFWPFHRRGSSPPSSHRLVQWSLKDGSFQSPIYSSPPDFGRNAPFLQHHQRSSYPASCSVLDSESHEAERGPHVLVCLSLAGAWVTCAGQLTTNDLLHLCNRCFLSLSFYFM